MIDVGEIARLRSTIVVDEDVTSGRGGDQAFAALSRGDIGGHRGYKAGGDGAQRGRGLFQFGRVTPIDNDIDPFPRQRLRASQAQPLAGAADNSGAAFNAEIHCLFPLFRAIPFRHAVQ